MREGDLLGHDLDLDISLWAENEADLKKIFPALKKAGYKMLSVSYKGSTFQYNFSLDNAQNERNIDIGLFRRCGEYAWCPEYYFKVNPVKSTSKKPVWSRSVRNVLRFCWRKFISKVPIKISVSAWPWRSFVNMGTWWVPAAYFDHLVFRTEFNAYIPREWESYLKLRYGNWTVPNTDWVFHRDDRGFRDIPPNRVSDKLP